MFPRRRKNLFHHLGVGVEPVLGSGPPPKDILVIQGRTKAAAETLVEGRGSGNKKNLQKFLGVPAVPAARSCSTRNRALNEPSRSFTIMDKALLGVKNTYQRFHI